MIQTIKETEKTFCQILGKKKKNILTQFNRKLYKNSFYYIFITTYKVMEFINS